MESLASDIPPGDGKTANLFFTVWRSPLHCWFFPTFDDELGGEVDSVGPVAGQAGVGAAVGRSQAVEQDVAAERHVLNREEMVQ